jgi:hypothetical protein
MGLGELETLIGGRKARAFESGSSAFVGQVRSTRSILAPQDPQSPARNVIDCWGLGIDAAINLTRSIGMHGELFTGSGMGEYNGGIGQTFERRIIGVLCSMRLATSSIPSSGGDSSPQSSDR